MFDPIIPNKKAFLSMLGNIEALYFVTNEIDHNFSYYPKSAFEIPFRTAIHQLLSIVYPMFSTLSESLKLQIFNDSLSEIDKWIQSGGSVEYGDMDNSTTFSELFEFFQLTIWRRRNLILKDKKTDIYNTRLHIIATNLRLFAELKQLERDLQRHSVAHEANLPFRNIVLDSVLCWIHIENKRNHWSNDMKKEIVNILFENGFDFFNDSVGFLPYAEYPLMIFLETATEFIRRADELTIEYRV
jgi:hypothetical protein